MACDICGSMYNCTTERHAVTEAIMKQLKACNLGALEDTLYLLEKSKLRKLVAFMRDW